MGANGGGMEMLAEAQLTVKGDAKELETALGRNSLVQKRKVINRRGLRRLVIDICWDCFGSKLLSTSYPITSYPIPACE